MPSPTLTRRALIAGAGTVIASAALAVPYVNSAHDLQADAALLSAAAIEAIADWNRKADAAALSWSDYKNGSQGTFPHDNPRYCRWFDLQEEARESQNKMLKLLRSTDLDLGHIYRSA